MKRTALILTLILSGLCLPGVSQEAKKPDDDHYVKLAKKLEGTYQVQVIDAREYFSMSAAMLDSIEATRHATETKYIWLKENTRIMIPSRAELNKPGFIPLQRVAYITSKEK